MTQTKILVIDDNHDILEVVTIILENAGYMVIAKDSGEYIQELAVTCRPDIILLDMLLSGENGIDIISHVKKTNGNKHIPIILNSAHPKAKDLWVAAGADDFIAKPFDIKSLLTIIEKHLPKK